MTNQNTYNRPPQGQMMPPPHVGAPRPRGWRGRWMRRFGMDVATVLLTKGALTIPNWVTGKAIVFFFVALFSLA